MSKTSAEFRQFLLRVAHNEMLHDDWQEFALQHFADEELESMRQQLVETSLEHLDWTIGWIPRSFQRVASELAERLREHPTESTYYRPEWHDFQEDGTLSIRTSWWDAESHSTGVCEISRDHVDYEFWCWVVSDPARSRGSKNVDAISELRTEYERTKNDIPTN
jgi:hypothetical protein